MTEVSPQINRVVEMSQAAEVGAMVMMTLSVPEPKSPDAIAVYPGLGETVRVEHAVKTWEDTPQAKHLLIAGVNPNENTYRPLTVETLTQEPYNLTRTDGVKSQISTFNTPSQAEWLADQVEENEISSIALHVTPFHLTRALATTIKVFERRGILESAPIVPVAVSVRPTAILPEKGVDGVAMFPGEAERIKAYQPHDVAGLEQLKEYIDWLYDQPVITG